MPESALAADLELPASTPPAPWATRVDAVLWYHRAAPSAASYLPVELAGPFVPVTAAAFVRYLESPVGPYSEIFASPVILRRGALHVPFIAVDSVASVHGGRTHWNLPKTLASFSWGDALSATGDGWEVSALAAPTGPSFPLVGGMRFAQLGGTAWVRMRGKARLGRVLVDSAGPTLPNWLLPGRHRALFISNGSMTITAPHV